MPRSVGREAEFPLVSVDGRAGDASRLWPLLMEEGCQPIRDEVPGGPPGAVIGVRGPGWQCLVEVGRCTVEVVVGPRPSLHDLHRDVGRALSMVLPAARRAGYRLLGYGIQPRTRPGPAVLAPKRRYSVMRRATGDRWLRWGVTASDQIHVAVSRDEVIPVLNALNGLSGAVIALTANSPVYGGRPGRFASGREGLMEDATGEAYRHGALPRPFADIEDWVRFVLGFRCLFLPDGRGGFQEPGRPMVDVIGGRPDLKAFLFHDHYVWPSARPRARLGTMEIRPACQQPPHESWAAAALAAGLAEEHRQAWVLVEDRFGPNGWNALLAVRRRAVRSGIRLGEEDRRFLGEVVGLAERGLAARGLGEEHLLDPVRARLERGEGPADVARRNAVRGGPPALVDALALG